MSAALLASLLKKIQLSPAGLAREARLALPTIQRILNGEEPGRARQHCIEKVLGQAVWSTPAEFAKRRETQKLFRNEPSLTGSKRLWKQARVLGIKNPQHLAGKEAVIAAIAARLAAKAKPEQPVISAEDRARSEASMKAFETAREWECGDCGAVYEPLNRHGEPFIPRRCRFCKGGRVWVKGFTRNLMLKPEGRGAQSGGEDDFQKHHASRLAQDPRYAQAGELFELGESMRQTRIFAKLTRSELGKVLRVKAGQIKTLEEDTPAATAPLRNQALAVLLNRAARWPVTPEARTHLEKLRQFQNPPMPESRSPQKARPLA